MKKLIIILVALIPLLVSAQYSFTWKRITKVTPGVTDYRWLQQNAFLYAPYKIDAEFNITDTIAWKSDVRSIVSGYGYYVGSATTIKGLFSSTATGLTYSNGVFSATTGYAIPTTTKQGQWDNAYSWGDHAASVSSLNARCDSTAEVLADTMQLADAIPDLGMIELPGNTTANILATTPTEGTIIFDSQTGKLCLYYDGEWYELNMTLKE